VAVNGHRFARPAPRPPNPPRRRGRRGCR
jgi:hypothetical protein